MRQNAGNRRDGASVQAGFAEHAFSRGTQIVDNYKFCGRNGHGQFIPRDHVGRP
jgi:hypothetical protein